MQFPSRYLCLLSVLMVACSSDSDNPDETLTPEDQSQDGPATVMDAGNFDSILSSSMTLLRADFYSQTELLLNQIEVLWSEDEDIEVGVTMVYDCEGGGTASRVLSQQISLDENRRTSELQLSNCVTGDATLDGSIGIDENNSSLLALGDGTRTLTLTFNELNVVQADSSEIITGSYEQYSDNTSSYRTTSATTQLYQRTEGSNTTSLSDATYTHQFAYVREQSLEGTELVRWRYSEAGNGLLSIGALGLVDVSLTVDPELVYINRPEEHIADYTNTLTSGALELSVPAGGQLEAEVGSLENSTVLYTLTDENAEQTTIEREWLSPAPL